MLLDFTYQKTDEWYKQELLLKLHPSITSEWQREVFAFLKDWLSEKNEFEVNTSGTTGSPKTRFFKRESMVASAHITLKTFDLLPGNTLLMCLPTKFVAGKMMLVRAIVGRMRLLALEPKTNPIKKLNQSIDFAAFTPHQLRKILIECPEKLNLIDKIIIGGSPVNDNLVDQLSTFAPVFYETYGMSETLTHIAIRQLNGKGKSDCFNVLKGFNISVNESECLKIDAYHLPNCPIVTSDIVELVKPDTFKWIARANDVINSGGVKLIPSVIEKNLIP